MWILSSALFAPAICGQAPLEQFTFTAPGSLAGNSGAPYSADEIHERLKPTAGGKLVAEPPELHHIYRDSQGRTRTERPVSHSHLLIVEIQDPVAGFEYVLDPQARIAHRWKVSRSRTYPIAKDTAESSRPAGSDQSLGTRMIEGFLAEGTRTVVHLEGGPSTIDMWKIPELSVLVLSRNTLPRSGVFITRLSHIQRSEPDPALFQAPSGYAVVDESSTVSFAITQP